MANRFAMFCGQRTGSTSIWLFLSAGIGAEILHEPFHPGRFNVDQMDVVAKLESIFREYVGFKHMHEHLPRDANRLLLDYASIEALPVLYLRRRDLTRRAISRELADKTGHWMKEPERQTEYRNLVKSTPLNIDVISKRLERDVEDEAVYSDMLGRVNSLDVFYEDVFAQDTATKKRSLDELCRHIGHPLTEEMQKHIEEYTGVDWHQNPEEIFRLIPNWSQIQGHFNVRF